MAGIDRPDLQIWSVQNGVFAFSKKYEPRNNVLSVSVGPSLDNAREFTVSENAEIGDRIRLSPTGAWLAYLLIEFDGPPIQDKVLAFSTIVRDTATGAPVQLKVPLAGLILPVMWLDDSTLQVLAIGVSPDQTAARANMYTCRVPDGSCVLAAELPPSAVEGSNLVLPTGKWIGEE